jgi:serine/threonine protein kinase
MMVFQRYMKDPESEDHQQLFDLVEKLLAYEASSRYSLRQAMRHPFFRKLNGAEDFLRGASSHSSSSERRSHSLSR